jgi:hypothetical protein
MLYYQRSTPSKTQEAEKWVKKLSLLRFKTHSTERRPE